MDGPEKPGRREAQSGWDARGTAFSAADRTTRRTKTRSTAKRPVIQSVTPREPVVQFGDDPAEDDEVGEGVADENRPEKIFRMFEEIVEQFGRGPARARQLPHPQPVQRKHARLHARQQKRQRQARRQKRARLASRFPFLFHRFPPAIPGRAGRRPPAPSVSGRGTSRIRRCSAPRPADARAARPSFRLRPRRPAREIHGGNRPAAWCRSRASGPAPVFPSRNLPVCRASARILPTIWPRMSSIVTDARRAAEFVQHHRQAALLLLQALEQLQQIHRLRHERRKFNRVGQVNLRDPAATRACSECRRWCPGFRRKSAGGGV